MTASLGFPATSKTMLDTAVTLTVVLDIGFSTAGKEMNIFL